MVWEIRVGGGWTGNCVCVCFYGGLGIGNQWFREPLLMVKCSSRGKKCHQEDIEDYKVFPQEYNLYRGCYLQYTSTG